MVEESLMMSRFDHRNVMKLIGVSIENYNTLYIVMPFMTHGSLLSYLRKHRAQLTIISEDDPDLVRNFCARKCMFTQDPSMYVKEDFNFIYSLIVVYSWLSYQQGLCLVKDKQLCF